MRNKMKKNLFGALAAIVAVKCRLRIGGIITREPIT